MESSHSPVARSRDSQPQLGVELRKTTVGAHRYASSTDHTVTLLTGTPVRISCRPSGARCVRGRGEIDLFPAGVTQEWFEDDASDLIAIRLSASLVRLAAQEMGLDADRAELAPRCQVRDARIEHIAGALVSDDGEGSPSGLVYRESLGLALAVHLLSRYPGASQSASAPSPSSRAGLSHSQLARVTDYIEAHLGDDVSLLRLARISGVSASHLRALFKRSVGVPIHEYVIRRRVERARSLLVEGELAASEIALQAGFSHQSHMARCMRRILGVTPTSVAKSRLLAVT